MSTLTEVGPEPTNGAKDLIGMGMPYIAHVAIVGTADILFHRWNCEAVKVKAESVKGSKAKKTDDLESYIWRDHDGMVCLPGEYLRMSVVHAAKFRQDPRSPRKSAMDLYKAGVMALTTLAPLGDDKWEYEHRCRVQVQRNGVTRGRPAFKAGWRAEIDLMVALPEYIPPDALHDTLVNAGRLIGVADHRPSYGRFAVQSFEVMNG